MDRPNVAGTRTNRLTTLPGGWGGFQISHGLHDALGSGASERERGGREKERAGRFRTMIFMDLLFFSSACAYPSPVGGLLFKNTKGFLFKDRLLFMAGPPPRGGGYPPATLGPLGIFFRFFFMGEFF